MIYEMKGLLCTVKWTEDKVFEVYMKVFALTD
jgi:hypothetical protein